MLVLVLLVGLCRREGERGLVALMEGGGIAACLETSRGKKERARTDRTPTKENKKATENAPVHLLALLDQVVAHPARDGQDRHALLHKVGLPPDLDEHVAHLVADLVVARLLVACF
jgi:hypothetical protein